MIYLTKINKLIKELNIEFEIICISNHSKRLIRIGQKQHSFPKFVSSLIQKKPTEYHHPKVGQKFKIDSFDYNYSQDFIRLPLFGLLPRSNFMKIEDYRNQKINDLLT